VGRLLKPVQPGAAASVAFGPLPDAAAERFSLTYRLAMAVCRPLAWWGRMRVEGLEALPRGGPVLLAANHDSYFDPLAIGMAASRRRQIRALAKAALWDVRGLGPILDGMRQVPIERATGDAGALSSAIDALRGGACIGVFPEGTISVGRKMRARSGFGRLALEVPEARLVCATVEGTPDYARFPKRPAVRVRFFEPASGQTRPGESPGELSSRLLAEIRALAPPVDAGRDPAATRAKWEAKAEALEEKRRRRGAAS
jgi:1-acyl-sn-glycerol-3-phosphate acyltransferase